VPLRKIFCAFALAAFPSFAFAASTYPVQWFVKSVTGKSITSPAAELCAPFGKDRAFTFPEKVFNPNDKTCDPYLEEKHDARFKDWDACVYAQGGKRIAVSSCVELIKEKQRGNFPDGGNPEGKRFNSLLANCFVYQALSTAKTAKVSYLRPFVLNDKTVESFPALMGSIENDDDVAMAKKAKTLGRYEKGKTTPVSRLKAKYIEKDEDTRQSSFEIDYEVAAFGDFNGDGIEDALVRSDETSFEGTWGTSNLFLITRLKPHGNLVLLKRF
jgi:hypothetical protein